MKTALILLLFLLEPVIARQGMLLHVSKNNCDKVQYIILSLNCFLFFILVKSLYLITNTIINYNYSPGESKKTTESHKVVEIEKVIISILFLTYLRI